MYSHTACQLGLVKVAYRFHPFFGCEVTVLRKTRYSGESAVMVQLSAGVVDSESHGKAVSADSQSFSGSSPLRFNVPCWMLDEAACSSVVLREHPLIDVNSLIALRRWIDGLAKTLAGNDDASDMIVKGDRHETRQRAEPAHTDAASDTADT